MKTSTVLSQLLERKAECGESLAKLKVVIDSILSLVETDDDKTSFDHYVNYLDAVAKEFEDMQCIFDHAHRPLVDF